MKAYFLYFFTAIFNIYVVLFYFGMSAGFSNYLPIFSLFGGIILFVIAIPFTVYKLKIGLSVAVIALTMMLPYGLSFIFHLFTDYSGGYSWALLIIMLPSILLLLSFILTVKYLVRKKDRLTKFGKKLKLVLAAIPLMIFIAYILLYGKEWSMEMFSI